MELRAVDIRPGRDQQAFIGEAIARLLRQLGEPVLLRADQKQRQARALDRGGDVLVAEKSALIGLEADRLAVDLGLEHDEIGRIVGRNGVVVRFRQIDLRKLESDGCGRRCLALVEEDIADPRLVGSDRQLDDSTEISARRVNASPPTVRSAVLSFAGAGVALQTSSAATHSAAGRRIQPIGSEIMRTAALLIA